MDYTVINQKLAYFQNNKHLIPSYAVENYEGVFRVDFSHNSTAIEGNTLSLSETSLLLNESLTPSGKNLREIYEVINHDKAFAYVKKCVSEGKGLDKDIVKDIHTIVMDNIMQGGVYRNVLVYISGSQHIPPSPIEAHRELEYFYAELHINKDKLHPIEFAAWTHAEFVKIHPFPDGNGRTARLIMNYQLLESGYLPISIPNQRRLEYFDALEANHMNNDITSFVALIAELEEKHLNMYITAIEQVKSKEVSGALTLDGLKDSIAKSRVNQEISPCTSKKKTDSEHEGRH